MPLEFFILALPRSINFFVPEVIVLIARSIFCGIPIILLKSFPDPIGKIASDAVLPISPVATSFTVR
jgi:hypothetical protein